MRKRILEYVKMIDEMLAKEEASEHPFGGSAVQADTVISRHLTQISFFMHERLIHLIVTVVFAILTFMSMMFFISSEQIMIFVLTIALLILLVPYIRHYYCLENNTQYMYKQYDRMIKLKDSL